MKMKNLKDLYGSNFVPDEGPVPCDLLLIGEAPGEQEDLEGKPFVGDCGDLINGILRRAGWPRLLARVTNAVKQRPPKNRKPTFEEIQMHQGYLMREITFCRPRCIVLLGKSAAQAFFNEKNLGSIWSLRRRIFYSGSRRVFVTYHPGAALRATSNKEDLEKDIKRAVRFLKGN